jgi:hypothetical protein
MVLSMTFKDLKKLLNEMIDYTDLENEIVMVSDDDRLFELSMVRWGQGSKQVKSQHYFKISEVIDGKAG